MPGQSGQFVLNNDLAFQLAAALKLVVPVEAANVQLVGGDQQSLLFTFDENVPPEWSVLFAAHTHLDHTGVPAHNKSTSR